MFRGLAIFAVVALGAAVGCSQNEGTTAPVLSGASAPSVAQTTSADDPDPATPAAADKAVANAPETPVAPARARQATRRGFGFVPLDDPSFLTAAEADYLGDEELVLGVEWGGEVRAYPVRMLRYHHVVNDTVGGEPLLVTY